MWMAERFCTEERYRIQALGKDGVRADDHPLIVQFAANTPAHFAEAALAAQKLGADGTSAVRSTRAAPRGGGSRFFFYYADVRSN